MAEPAHNMPARVAHPIPFTTQERLRTAARAQDTAMIRLGTPRLGRDLARQLREMALLASVIAADMAEDAHDAAQMLATEANYILNNSSGDGQSLYFLSGSLYLRLKALRSDILEARDVTDPNHIAQLFRGFAERLNAIGDA